MFVSGSHDGRRIIVGVTVLSASARPFDAIALERLNALIDTGASATSIAPEAAQRLGLKSIETREVRTASGSHNALVYEFSIGFFPDEQSAPYVLPTPVRGVELSFGGSAFDILLGMDVLARGDLILRRDRSYSFEF
jgi:predicted aspartyl protease